MQTVYAPYLEKYGDHAQKGELTYAEWGHRILDDFLAKNEAGVRFNEKQRIILAASDYDDLTLSSVAWLSQNGVDLSCYTLTPYLIGEDAYIHVDKLIPSIEYDDYYINLDRPAGTAPRAARDKPALKRRSLPKIDKLLAWGAVKAGDVIEAKDKPDEAVLLENGNVEAGGEEMSLQVWLKNLYGWSSIQTYVFAIHQASGKSLSAIRRDYMERDLDLGSE
ncbi:hypothetical protein [Salisediminibacterium halotolerans]|uniref:Uncharacterized protein n=1 Tax=Salisediminibacterium halotolerans TaxID=517425 RepID=A0A1H9T202_9BACI|nr:hypothetical protein [Salisediminibacterium haloalkalitolerans]SER91107.1 hypothetical protein SAMN05444126_108102 [Salisediminibacterium haloalkalitolerans]